MVTWQQNGQQGPKHLSMGLESTNYRTVTYTILLVRFMQIFRAFFHAWLP